MIEETEQHKSWTAAKKQTKHMTLREAARKAGIGFAMGFSACYLNGARTEFRDAREAIGRVLIGRKSAKQQEIE